MNSSLSFLKRLGTWILVHVSLVDGKITINLSEEN